MSTPLKKVIIMLEILTRVGCLKGVLMGACSSVTFSHDDMGMFELRKWTKVSWNRKKVQGQSEKYAKNLGVFVHLILRIRDSLKDKHPM